MYPRVPPPRDVLTNLLLPRSLTATVMLQVLNIILFPVSVAASFVTLSWNTSQSLARDYILQVSPV